MLTRLSGDAVPTITPSFRGFDTTVDRSKLLYPMSGWNEGLSTSLNFLPGSWSGKGVYMSINEGKGLGDTRSCKGWNVYQYVSVFGVTSLITVYVAPKRGLRDTVRCWQLQLTIVSCRRKPTIPEWEEVRESYDHE